MIACLPMYDWPELRQAHDSFWHKLADHLNANGLEAPAALSPSKGDETYWLEPDLLLGQTCGYPLSTALNGKVAYLATPVYAVKGCTGPYYSSAIVAGKTSSLTSDTMTDSRFAYNSDNSLSGYRAIKHLVGEPAEYFSALVQTGSHRNSARLVANGSADVATLDAVCWHLLQQFEPETADRLKVIGWTSHFPALPLITSLKTPDRTIEILRKVLTTLPPEHDLAINGFEVLSIADYNKLSAL